MGVSGTAAALAATAAAALFGAGGARAIVVEHPEPTMQVIPAGTFLMGMPDTPEERQDLTAACTEQFGIEFAEFCGERRYRDALGARRVLLFAYAIDRHEVTVAEYRRCASAGACDVGPLVAGDGRYLRGEWPMVNVTWQDAADFCAWRGARLPTEAEWEKAARGTDGRRFPWGDHVRRDGGNHGRAEDLAMSTTHGLVGGAFGRPLLQLVPDPSAGSRYPLPPGTLRWGASPYGVYDMAGNASEWVADYYHPQGYGDLPRISPVRRAPTPGLNLRVVRGGSWLTPRFYGRTYYRHYADPESRSSERGFRCAAGL
jgi:formylglycine-generating enzyme